jgi:hypothetical protein
MEGKMRNSILVILGAMALVGYASAQTGSTTNYMPTNLTFRAGGGFAIAQSLNQSSTSFYGGGLDFGYGRGFTPGSETYYSADYLWGSGKSTNDGLLPVYINARFFTDKATDSQNAFGQARMYLLAGLGAMYYQIGGGDLKPSVKLGAGVELSQNVEFETNFLLAQQSKQGVAGNVVAFFLGYHFR